MNGVELLGAVGALVQTCLALLFLLVWRSLGLRWACWLALGFAAIAVLNLQTAFGLYQTGLDDAPLASKMVFACLSLVAFSTGFVLYIGMSVGLTRRLVTAAAIVAALTLALALSGQVSRRIILPVQGLFAISWAALFLLAWWRERGQGHGIIATAMMLFPLMIAAGLAGLIPAALLNGLSIAPLAILGMTLLYAGLVRAHNQATEALAERERSEAALVEANQTLEARVLQRTAELSQVIDGLESFTRNVSHDLRGPLGGLAGLARLARLQLADGQIAQARELLEAIERQAQISASLVGALLGLARAGDCPLHPVRIDTGPMVAEILQSWPRPGDCTGLPVQVGALPPITADPDLARQVFVNIIGNALKYSAGRAQPRVEVGVLEQAGPPMFYVRDNGAGFSPQQAEQLFRPFHRLHGNAYEGFGVGLSIVKRILDRHGGSIHAEGETDHGACFYFSFG